MVLSFNLVHQPSSPPNDLTRIINTTPYRKHTILDTTVSYILGPYFEDVAKGSPLDDYLPYHYDEELMLFTDPDKWITRKQIRSWPLVDDKYLHEVDFDVEALERLKWEDWYKRLQPYFGNRWASTGIAALLQFSIGKLSIDHSLLLAVACFWSTSCNCFLFPCGPMTLTVLDVVALTGVNGFGTCISPLLQIPVHPSFPNRDQELSPKSNEHQRFILHLLNMFIFCPTSGRMSSEYQTIALYLAAGHSLNLAPYLLSTFYRSMSQLNSGADLKDVGGPFWILQLWLYSYFPEIAPTQKYDPSHSCYGHQWLNTDVTSQPFSVYFDFFSSLTTARSAPLFVPFTSRILGPPWFVNRNPTNDVVFTEFVANCLIPRDLPVKDSMTVVGSTHGVEVYCPNYVARQFGFTQGIPMPMYAYSWNYPLCKNNHTELVFQHLQTAFQMNVEQNHYREFEDRPYMTHHFDEWWTRIYAARIRPDPTSFVTSLVSFEGNVEFNPNSPAKVKTDLTFNTSDCLLSPITVGTPSMTLASTDMRNVSIPLQQLFQGPFINTPKSVIHQEDPIFLSYVQLKQKMVDIFSKECEDVLTGPLLTDLSEVLSALKSHILSTDEQKSRLASCEELLILAPEFQRNLTQKPKMEEFFLQSSNQEIEFGALSAHSHEHRVKLSAWEIAKDDAYADLAIVQSKIEQLKVQESTLKTVISDILNAKKQVESDFQTSLRKTTAHYEHSNHHIIYREQMEAAWNKLHEVDSRVHGLWVMTRRLLSKNF